MVRFTLYSILIFLLFLSLNSFAQNSAKGILTINGSSTDVKYAYIDEGAEDVFLVFTDRPVSKENIPFGLDNLSSEDKARGIVITILKSTKQITPGLNAIYHPVFNGQLGTIGNGVLTINKFSKSEIEGKISTPSENTFGSYIFSYEISFNVKAGEPKKTEPLTIEIQGAKDAPSKAYAAYYRAVMAGDKTEIRMHLESGSEKNADDETLDYVIDFARTFRPTTLKINGSEIKGKEALLKVEGLRDEETSTGSVTMRIEGGKWKVLMDSWKVNTN
ncbi:MAG: hypothetical protein ACRENO_00735 [Thermodesulfobacteriota bacterium]